MAVDAPGAVGVTAILEDYDRLLLAADHAPWLSWLPDLRVEGHRPPAPPADVPKVPPGAVPVGS